MDYDAQLAVGKCLLHFPTCSQSLYLVWLRNLLLGCGSLDGEVGQLVHGGYRGNAVFQWTVTATSPSTSRFLPLLLLPCLQVKLSQTPGTLLTQTVHMCLKGQRGKGEMKDLQ